MAKRYILTRDDVKNNLTSTDTNKPLSANQGKVLQETKQNILSSSNPLNADYVSDGTANKVYTATEKTKLEGIETGAQVNKIESIKANGTVLAITDKSVNIPLATKSTAGLTYLGDVVRDVYVSPSGSDTTGDGTYNNPWREIQTAIYETSDLPNQVICINCAQGEYNYVISHSSGNGKTIILNIGSNSITLNTYISVSGGKLIITGDTNSTFNVISNSSYGIFIDGGAEFSSSARLTLNVTAKETGVHLHVSDFLPTGFDETLNVQHKLNINLTATSGAKGIYCERLGIVTVNDLTVNGAGTGNALYLTNGPNKAYIGTLTTNLTQYTLEYGSVLAIGGQWINQSGGGGGGVWGQITGDINTQSDLTSFVNSKPTILSGTVEPTPDMGSVGDLYVRYDE